MATLLEINFPLPEREAQRREIKGEREKGKILIAKNELRAQQDLKVLVSKGRFQKLVTFYGYLQVTIISSIHHSLFASLLHLNDGACG